MKKIFLLLLFLPISVFAQKNIIEKTFKKISKSPCFNYGNIGIYVIDSASEKVIFKHNEQKIFKPASTQKILTTAAALEIFGTNYKFKTLLQYDGFVDTSDKILFGNIYIKGMGDPTLGSRFFDKEHSFLQKWISAIKNLNIKRIEGKIIGDATYFDWDVVPPKWTWEDLGNYYGAGIFGLAIFDNLYTIYFKTPPYSGGKTKIIKVEPYIPNLKIKNFVRSANIKSDKAYIYGAPYTYERYVKGWLPKNKDDFKVKGSMPDPTLFAAYLLFNELKKDSIFADTFSTIRLLKDSIYLKSKRKNLITLYSPPLKDIVKITNSKSVNLFAEYLARQIALKITGSSSWDSVSVALIRFWTQKGLNPKTLKIYDGSGLSHYNGISAQNMVLALKYIMKSDFFNVFKSSLAITGQKGTLKYYCKGKSAQGRIYAKTGTLSRVKAFAGYAYTLDGRTLIFAIFFNNYTCKHSYAKKYFEQILNALVLYKY